MARGSIRRRSARSRQLVYDLPPGPDGKRRHKYETVQSTKRQADARLAQILLSISRGRFRQDEHNQGTPMLSALVVRRRYGIPGPGFFESARHLGKSGHSRVDAFVAMTSWVDGARRVWDWWE